jgi:4,5-dihydroxyphthalate decarboxylase
MGACRRRLHHRARSPPDRQIVSLAVQEAHFDVTELSLSSHILQVARGDAAYTAIPCFISRAFRHNGFFRRARKRDRNSCRSQGQNGRVPEYQMTAALWMRGILKDDFGVDAVDIHWRTGALDAGVRHERLALTPPPSLKITPIEDGETLQGLLLAGEIDALLAPNPPKAFIDGDPRIERIFPDFEAEEQAYHARTGFFPIMHVIAVRKTLADAHPDLPRALFDAFSSARDIALKRLHDVWLGSANRLSLPWLNASMERIRATLGRDYYPYGFKRAEHEVEAMCRYSVEQHLAPRHVSARELIHPSLLET